jgi:Cu(I)/Ag(I) efflux system membrane fusion protein
MRKLLTVLLFLALLAVSFWAGSWYRQQGGAKVAPSIAKSASVNAVESPHTDTDTNTNTSVPLPRMVRVNAVKQQLIGVRTDEARRAPASHLLRVSGRIAVDEGRLYRLIASVDGWVRELGQNPAGTFVKKDQILASYYTQNLQAAQLALLSNISASAPWQRGEVGVGSPRSSVSLNLQIAIDGLRSLGMSDLQIQEFQKTQQYASQIHVYSPISGFVLARNISPVQRFDKGTELYRVADLSRVWVLADLFENEAQYIKAGARVRVNLPYQKKTFPGTVSDVLPQFDAATRTLKVRLEVANAEYSLRPDMFVDIELPIQLPPAITVPADAVLDSGLKKTVFVDLGNGFFEPREVETGWRIGNRVEIVSGLKPGEKVVVSGNFLIDSESRLELAAAGMVGTLSRDPVCGADVSISKAEKEGRRSTYQGKVYYFSSDECKALFEKNPNSYVKEP